MRKKDRYLTGEVEGLLGENRAKIYYVSDMLKLHPDRNSMGHRLFSEDDVNLLKLAIDMRKKENVSYEVIRQRINLGDDDFDLEEYRAIDRNEEIMKRMAELISKPVLDELAELKQQIAVTVQQNQKLIKQQGEFIAEWEASRQVRKKKRSWWKF